MNSRAELSSYQTSKPCLCLWSGADAGCTMPIHVGSIHATMRSRKAPECPFSSCLCTNKDLVPPRPTFFFLPVQCPASCNKFGCQPNYWQQFVPGRPRHPTDWVPHACVCLGLFMFSFLLHLRSLHRPPPSVRGWCCGGLPIL